MSIPIPPSMRYVACPSFGGPEVMQISIGPLPAVGPADVLVRVAFAGVNRPDVLQRQGAYPPPADASPVLGLEISGTVAAAGADSGWKVGDTVCGLAPGGGYAEYCALPGAHCLPIPAGLDLRQAAALPETCFTVWTNVFERARLQPGQSFLVHGGASGIGTTAIQMARAFGARVFTTVGGPEKQAACRQLGAELSIDYRSEDFVAAIKAATGKRGVDVILDMVGGPYVQRNLSCLAVEGRLVHIAFLQGSKVEVDLMPMMMKRQTITGSTLRARSKDDKSAIARALQAQVWPRIADGQIRPVIAQVFPLDEVQGAHRLMESNGHIGKILLAAQ
jgi:putative PIG3 family NAD(P)H quinone oxidoreductase